MCKLRNASCNTQVLPHGFGKRVSRENRTMKLVKAALDNGVPRRDFATTHGAI
jgi:hypothetical protein